MSTPISTFWTLEDALRTSHLVPNQPQQVLRYGRIHSAEQIRKDLERTARALLDPLCERFGKGTLSSGYRSPELNRIIGGAANSAHTVGLAYDWQPAVPLKMVIEWALSQPALPFDRLIVEQRGKTRWLHVQAGEEGFAAARVIYESPQAGIYTLMTPERIEQLQV